MDERRWQRIDGAERLEAGERTRVVLDGEDGVVWRTRDGRPAACAARCPHQWSDLADEGFVDGDELVCSAHGWRFTVDGTGSKVDVRGRRHVMAPVPSHPCRESDEAGVEVGLIGP
jgi:nitrite reductase/ring-hydroxylating ferredoxin subunit